MTTPFEATSGDADGHILSNLLMFAEVLRKVGLDVGSSNVLDLVRALEYAPIGRKQDFRMVARTILVHRKQDLPIFDEAFQAFWRRPALHQTTHDLRSMGERRRYRNPQVTPPRSGNGDETGPETGEDDGPPGDRVDLTRTYSAREVLRQKDFSSFSPVEIAEAKQMMTELSWDLGRRRTRRMAPGNGDWLDLRRTLRLNLKYGGEILETARREQKDKPRSLVLLCDVSGSMERYTRMLLHFIHSVARGQDRVEAFLFATRLTRITRYLNHRSIDQAVTDVARAVPDWAGGTRIGEAIKTFNYQWLRRVLESGAVALVISDGWDRGDPELLAQEISRLQRSCHRLIWLNPLLGSPGYEPLTRGMQAAMPYIDDFLPVHNLNSLEELARHLNNLSDRRTPFPSFPRRRETRRGQALGSRYSPPTEPQPEPAAAQAESKEAGPATAPTFRHPLWGRGPGG